MAATQSPASVFKSTDLDPPDVQFDVTRRLRAATHPVKINLCQGTYRDEDGQLPFVDEATRLLFDGSNALAKTGQVASCQSLSGTGALHLLGLALRRLGNASKTIYVTDPTWVNLNLMGFEVGMPPCYKDGAFDFDAYLAALKEAIPGSPVVLHTSTHNPTGCDLSREEWKTIGATVVQRKLFPIFDSAYLGFNSGSFDDDAWPIRYFVDELGVELAVCLSMAKKMGLYGEPVRLVSCVTASASAAQVASPILQRVQRSTITAPPAYGGRVAAKFLDTPSIREQWSKDLMVMSNRIQAMRRRLYEELVRLNTAGDWSHVAEQTGMFSYLGISKSQISYL